MLTTDLDNYSICYLLSGQSLTLSRFLMRGLDVHYKGVVSDFFYVVSVAFTSRYCRCLLHVIAYNFWDYQQIASSRFVKYVFLLL